MVNPARSAAVNVHVPLPLFIPLLRLAPFGTPEIVTLKISEPLLLLSADVMESGIAVSSLPLAAATDNVGASAMPPTTMLIAVGAVLALVPFSDDVATTERFNVPL